MAIITISRKIASFGDETAIELAKLLNYNFVDRKSLEKDLLAKGISEVQLKKYDERKPSFWASLSRERDSYFDYLREAVYEHASSGNSIFIGRGGFAILRHVPGLYSVRLVNEDSSEYNLVINTGHITPLQAAEIIKYGFEKTVSKEEAASGDKRLKELLLAQRIVNHISFDLKLQIYFLEADISKDEIILHGVADNAGLIQKAIDVAQEMAGGRKVSSAISMVNEYKPFP